MNIEGKYSFVYCFLGKAVAIVALSVSVLFAYDASVGYVKPAAHTLKSTNYSVSEAKVGASLGFAMSSTYTTYTLLSDIESIPPSVPGTLNNVYWTNQQPGSFDYPDATDNTGGSGVDGYRMYWGVEPGGMSPSIWSKQSEYTPAPLSGSNVYYLRAQTQDNAGNVSSWATIMYYQYDQDDPCCLECLKLGAPMCLLIRYCLFGLMLPI